MGGLTDMPSEHVARMSEHVLVLFLVVLVVVEECLSDEILLADLMLEAGHDTRARLPYQAV